MMNALVTGSSGTVGSVLCSVIRKNRGTAIGWDRDLAAPGDESATQNLIQEVDPDVIFHTALPSKSTGIENEGRVVNEKWTSDIARCASAQSIPMVYTSTVMVYTNEAQGTFTPETPPEETEGYGLSKLMGEKAAKEANHSVRIARLGWQIGNERGTNNMIHYFLDQQEKDGRSKLVSIGIQQPAF
jgi:dTDP-4-dehydrorhamnose reductase